MNSKEAFAYVEELIKKHVPYKENPPYSLEEGYNCLGWAVHLRNKITGNTDREDLDPIRPSLLKYKRIKTSPQFLDVPVFSLDTFGNKHVGLMLDSTYVAQCCKATNGLSIVNVANVPWKNLLKAFYRHR